MNRWYSARGARRGLKASVCAIALWLLWAVGYVQGIGPAAPPAQASPAAQQPPCCFAAPRT